MIQERLNDAAIALYKGLTAAGIKHGIFGGYAIQALGGPRESKDIDCIASVDKQQVINILNGKEGFEYINQSRDDYVAFFWSDKPSRENAVLVEIFVESFPGATLGMQSVQPTYKQVVGQTAGRGYTSHLDPTYIFKGKLRAAATRGKFHDSADLRWLEGRHSAELVQRKYELNLEYVGLAMKRYPELELVFSRIGLDITAAKAKAAPLDLKNLPPPQQGDVQKGLFMLA